MRRFSKVGVVLAFFTVPLCLGILGLPAVSFSGHMAGALAGVADAWGPMARRVVGFIGLGVSFTLSFALLLLLGLGVAQLIGLAIETGWRSMRRHQK